MSWNECRQKGIGILLHYETVKIIDIKNKKVGALYRFIQLIIISYVIGFVIVYKKGYQEFDEVISTATTKLKGTTYVDFGKFNSSLFNGIRTYDPADYVIPPQETNAVFIMTNMIITPKQTQSKCPEDPKFKEVHCTSDSDCPEKEPVRNGNGIMTGKCVKSDRNESISVCQIYGWCPTEVDILPMPNNNFSDVIPLLDGTKYSTMLVKNQITFPKFKALRNNLISFNDSSYLKGCLYNKDTDPLCPIFKLDDIISSCGDNYSRIGYQGAVYGIIIKWDCNLDKSIDECLPEYQFKRLDDENSPISPGYNYRFAQYYVEDGIKYRTLTKAYGIKFEILVNGRAGKFNIIPLLTNLGAGMALLGIATVWCDFIVMYLLKKRNVYREHKYQRVDDDMVNCLTSESKDSVNDDIEHDEKENEERPESERLLPK